MFFLHLKISKYHISLSTCQTIAADGLPNCCRLMSRCVTKPSAFLQALRSVGFFSPFRVSPFGSERLQMYFWRMCIKIMKKLHAQCFIGHLTASLGHLSSYLSFVHIAGIWICTSLQPSKTLISNVLGTQNGAVPQKRLILERNLLMT